MDLKTYLENTSQSKFAESIGVSQGTVSHWITGRVRIPAERVLAIEAATEGCVSRHEMRPDIYPAERFAA